MENVYRFKLSNNMEDILVLNKFVEITTLIEVMDKDNVIERMEYGNDNTEHDGLFKATIVQNDIVIYIEGDIDCKTLVIRFNTVIEEVVDMVTNNIIHSNELYSIQ